MKRRPGGKKQRTWGESSWKAGQVPSLSRGQECFIQTLAVTWQTIWTDVLSGMVWERYQPGTELENPSSFLSPVQPQPKSTVLHHGRGILPEAGGQRSPWGETRPSRPGEHRRWARTQLASQVEIPGQSTSYLGVGITAWTAGVRACRRSGTSRVSHGSGSWFIAPRPCQLYLVSLGPLLVEFSTQQAKHCQKNSVRKSL